MPVAVIAHRDAARSPSCRAATSSTDAALVARLDRVPDEVVEHAAERARVGADGEPFGGGDGERPVGHCLEVRRDLREERPRLDPLGSQRLERPGARKLEQAVDEAPHPGELVERERDLGARLVGIGLRVRRQQLQVAARDRQRRPQLVRDVLAGTAVARRRRASRRSSIPSSAAPTAPSSPVPADACAVVERLEAHLRRGCGDRRRAARATGALRATPRASRRAIPAPPASSVASSSRRSASRALPQTRRTRAATDPRPTRPAATR